MDIKNQIATLEKKNKLCIKKKIVCDTNEQWVIMWVRWHEKNLSLTLSLSPLSLGETKELY